MKKYNPPLFKKVIKLYFEGTTQKEISIQCELTEKTVAKWLKPIKAKKTETENNIKVLNNKLNLLLSSENPNVKDIKDITTAISNLENIWFNQIINIKN